MNDWGITTKVPAEVVLAEGIVLAGDLHLYARPTYPPGPETVLEMLNRDDTFFALTLDGGVTFLAKSQVAGGLQPEPGHAHRPRPRVRRAAHRARGRDRRRAKSFAAGRRSSCRPSRSRTLDYLNGAGRFFAIATDDVTWYVNKARVRVARPLD